MRKQSKPLFGNNFIKSSVLGNEVIKFYFLFTILWCKESKLVLSQAGFDRWQKTSLITLKLLSNPRLKLQATSNVLSKIYFTNCEVFRLIKPETARISDTVGVACHIQKVNIKYSLIDLMRQSLALILKLRCNRKTMKLQERAS